MNGSKFYHKLTKYGSNKISLTALYEYLISMFHTFILMHNLLTMIPEKGLQNRKKLWMLLPFDCCAIKKHPIELKLELTFMNQEKTHEILIFIFSSLEKSRFARSRFCARFILFEIKVHVGTL